MSKLTKFILAIAVQLVVIAIIIIFKLAILANGNEVLLRIMPVDPRDWLRGDYITFQYDISNINRIYFSGESITNGDTVYVVLGKHSYSTSWYAERVSKAKPSSGEVFIRGKIASGGKPTAPSPALFSERLVNEEYHVVYGVEEYFIPEGTGQNINFFNQEVVAKVVLDKNGQAVLRQVYVDQKPWP